MHIGNLYNKDTIGTTVSCPVYGGVFSLEDTNVTCQYEECQMGQSSGVLLKEVVAFQRCPSKEVPLHIVCMGVHT